MKKIMMRFVSIIVLWIPVFSNVSAAPTCFVLDKDSEDRTSSVGYRVEQLSRDVCARNCAEQEFTYAELMSGYYCICGDAAKESNVKLYPCTECHDSLDDNCTSDDIDISSLNIIDMDEVGVVLNATISVEKAIFSTDEPVEIKLVVDGSGPLMASIMFGDGTRYTLKEEPFVVKKYYVMPGDYTIRAYVVDVHQINQAILDEANITIEDKQKNFELSCPDLAEPGNITECTLNVISGSYLRGTVQTTELEDIQFEIPDPYMVSLGQSVPPLIGENERTTDVLAEEIHIPYSTVNLPSRLQGFEYYAAKEGTIELLVLSPMCCGDEFCEGISACGCDPSCPNARTRTCGDDKVLCSFISQCVDVNSQPRCERYSNFSFNLKYSIETSCKEGYNYYPTDEPYVVMPGDIVGFKTTDSPICYRNATAEEIEAGIRDVAVDDELTVRHYFRAIVSQPYELLLRYLYNLTGNHSLSVSMENFWNEEAQSKTTSFQVQIPVASINLTLSPITMVVDEGTTAVVSIGSGSDVRLLWDHRCVFEEQLFEGAATDAYFNKTFTCESPGVHLVNVTVSNPWSTETLSQEYRCYYPVTRNWTLTSDSPRLIPPGKINFELAFEMSPSFLSTPTVYEISYGDCNTDDPVEMSPESSDDVWHLSFSHAYPTSGNFTISVNISNPVDYEVFEATVFLYDTIGNLSVEAFYVKNGSYPEGKQEMKGKDKTDAPLGSVVYFENTIEGLVTKYVMAIDDLDYATESEDSVIAYEFPKAGEWSIRFIAWDSNVDQYTNNATLLVRILEEVPDVGFNASAVEVAAGETVDFAIKLSKIDDHTCVMFDGGDGKGLLAFGSKDACTTRYDESRFTFIEKTTSRKRRDVKNAEWTDDSTISVVYSYAHGGDYSASVDVFNTVSEIKKSITITVSDGDYPTPLVWINKNSTDISKPIQRERGYDFRFETTAIFRSNESYRASHQWTIYKIEDSGNEVELDISNLKTNNCSAIRVYPRFLEYGIYKLKYTITVYEEPKMSQDEHNDDKVADVRKVNYDEVDYSQLREDFNDKEEEAEEENYASLSQNGTFLGRRSTFSYIEIISTPLVPKLSESGASYVVRGFGQSVKLQPMIYTENPDDPEDKDYDITWFCTRADTEETLTKIGEYEYDKGTPSSPITDRSTVKEENYKGGCFGEGPGLIEIGSGDFEFKADTFWTWDALYRITAVIRKDSKVAEGHLLLNITEKRPPAINVRCEKRVACFPQGFGQFINPNSWVPLAADCVEDCGDGDVKYGWTIYSSSQQDWERGLIENWEKHVTVDEERIGLNQSLFKNNPDTKTFLVEATAELSDPEIPRGVSFMFLILNTPPQGGTCTMSPTSGMALLQVFMINYADWIDKENHEIVDYSIFVKYKRDFLRLEYGLRDNFGVILPYGDIEVICTVTDSIGGVTRQSVANLTTTLPSEDQVKEFYNSRKLDLYLAEGRMSMASQVVIARSSIFTEYFKRMNLTEKFNQVRETAVMKEWEEYLNKQGIDSSYYTPQAKEEIREELLEKLEKEQDKFAKLKDKEIIKVLKLPMEALPDVEIYGGALNSVADTGPITLKGKEKLMTGMDKMFAIINTTDVPHPENMKTAFEQFGNLADTIAGSLAESNIGGQFLPFEVKKAETVLNYNATEKNYFIYYVDGDKQQVRERLKERVIGAAQDEQSGPTKEMVTKMKDMISSIQQKCMEDIMAGSDPFYTETNNGFQMTFLKNSAATLSGEVIQQGGSSFTLPDICDILGDECEGNDTAFGIQSVRWTKPLESYGGESGKLSDDSNVVQIELTPRDGRQTLSVNNTSKPFLICIPVKNNDTGGSDMKYVIPKFSSPDDILVYHTLFIESSGVGVNVNIKPDYPKAPLVVMYKYGDQPSLMDYDGISALQQIPSQNGVYSLYISKDVLNEPGRNLSVGIGHLSNTTDKSVLDDLGRYNLTVVNMTNEFSSNYYIKIATSGCYYFSEKDQKWSSEGCQVTSSGFGVTCCACNHLTSFGSGFFVPPNTIDFSYVFAHAQFHDNITIYVTLIVLLSVFVLLLIYARWKDRRDVQLLGASPLPDNEASYKYVYEILVFSGHQRNAGTKSNVFFIASGEEDETEVRQFVDDKRPVLQKGSVDVFVMAVPRPLGQLNYLRIWHDNSGKGRWSSWYCQYIVFRDVQTGHKFEFLVDQWFALEKDDGLIDRLIPVAGREQVTEFSHLFSTNSRRNLADSHLWFSVFLRPPRSRFTRVQRVCCCMAVLCLSMLCNAMYYQRTAEKPSGGFKFGPFSLSPEQIAVGIVTNVIIFPPTFIMIFFFRKSRPRTLRPSRIEEALKRQRREWRKLNPELSTLDLKHKSDAEAQQYHRKKKFTLPWWCVFFGWLLVIGSVGCSFFFMWAYGIEFGDEKTAQWLTSLVIAFFSSMLITQPIKIILLAIVVSCLCRSVDYDEDDADEDEEDPHLQNDEEYLHDPKRGKRKAYRPMDLEALEEARKEREKEVKMFNVIREISAYFFFFWIIMILSYGNRDTNNFYLREALVNGFVKPGDLWVDYRSVNTEKRFWNWTFNALLPELFAYDWYNGNPPLGLRLFLDDRNNLKISYAVMRQIRIKPRSCKVHLMIEDVTPDCAGYSSIINEDGTLYTRGWKPVNSSETSVPPEYKYLTAAELKGYPFWGQVDWYGGGGYVVPLLIRRDSDIPKLKMRLARLEREGWIDRHTRAVFVEIATYNAQVNLFCSLTILAEFLPGGGVIPYYQIDPLPLLNYHTGFGLIQLVAEILFVIFTLFFTIKELRAMFREGRKYFSQYWNITELVSLVTSYTGIANHVYKMFATREIMRIFTETEGTGYVKLQEMVLLNELYCYQIGLVMSIATLKFLKLLRFNKRIGILSGTLRKCAAELQSYSVCLMVVFMAFVILFWLLLGRAVREFSTFVYAFESSISMMLKKFNYETMYMASPIFTPIAFFTFSLATSVVLINILLTIIIRSFEDVKHDVSKQSNEYEILDYFVNRLKMITGIGRAKVRPIPSMYRDKKKPPDTVSTFPDKVDKLVDFINGFYFENQVDFNSKDFLKKMNAEIAAAPKKKSKPVKASKSKLPVNVAKNFKDF